MIEAKRTQRFGQRTWIYICTECNDDKKRQVKDTVKHLVREHNMTSNIALDTINKCHDNNTARL